MRRVYAEYLSGKSPKTIAQALTADGVVTPRGKTTWSTTTVRSILTNEKYKGDALLQKTFTTGCTTPHLAEDNIRDAFTQAMTMLAPAARCLLW